MYRYRLFLHHLLFCWDEKHVVVLYGHVCHRAVHYAFDVYRYDFECAVFLHSVHHGTCSERLLAQSLCILDECAHAVYVVAHLVHAGTEHGTFYLHHVREARQHRVYTQRVFIGKVERTHVKLVDVVYRIFLARLAYKAHRLAVGVARKSSCIFKYCRHALVLAHLVEHGALHLARDVYKAVVRTDNYHVVVGKAHVAGQFPVKDVVVYVDHRHEAVVSVYLYVTQRTQLVCASSHVKCMENGGECRQRVCARRLYLAHYVHHYGACLPYGQLYLRTAVPCTQLRAQLCVCLCHGHAADIYRSEALYGYRSLGRYRPFHGLLRCAVYVDKHRIARSETVALRCCDVHCRFECKAFVVEDVTSENFFLVLLFHQLLEQGGCVGGQYVRHFLLHHHELLVVLVVCTCRAVHRTVFYTVLRLFSLVASVVAAQSFCVAVVGSFACGAEPGAFCHPLVLVSYTPYLTDVHAALHQLCHYLSL